MGTDRDTMDTHEESPPDEADALTKDPELEPDADGDGDVLLPPPPTVTDDSVSTVDSAPFFEE